MPDSDDRPTKSRRITMKAVGAVIAAAMLVAALAVGVWQATTWEATPEPTSSVGTSEALRGWLALAAVLGTAVATGFLAFFARRLPEGVGGLLKRLDDAEAARRNAEEERQKVETVRDVLAARLSRPYLYGEAVPADSLDQWADVTVSEPGFGGVVAPSLDIRLPKGRLPQELRLEKEDCREWYADIERAEREEDGVAVVRFSNVWLAATVNAPHDDETGASLGLFPQTSDPGPQVAWGMLHSWSQFRDAVKEVGTHRLPSIDEFKRLRAKENPS